MVINIIGGVQYNGRFLPVTILLTVYAANIGESTSFGPYSSLSCCHRNI